MSASTRWPAIDLLRIASAHLIVWHHFAIYSGMADAAWGLAPDLFRALADHARKVVQVFLVMGGFFAARTLIPLAVGVPGPVRSRHGFGHVVVGRFMRLAPLVWLAIVAVVLVERVLRGRGADAASTIQVLANAVLLQDVLGVPSISAGLWYVAIDFQLYACAAVLAWAASDAGSMQRVAVLGAAVVATLLSAWVFNLDASGDAWAPYFMAAYGLGMLAWWSGQRVPGAGPALWLSGLGVAVAVGVHFRDRLLLALLTAGILVWVMRRPRLASADAGGGLDRLHRHADATYALFLLHYPVLLLVDATWAAWLPSTAWVQAAGILVAWVASVAVAHLVHDALVPGISRLWKH